MRKNPLPQVLQVILELVQVLIKAMIQGTDLNIEQNLGNVKEMSDFAKSLDPDKKYLIVSSPENPPSATDITRINFLDGSPAFFIKEL